MTKPIKIIKTPVSIQQAIDFAKARQHFWKGELARANACVECRMVGIGCDAKCPHL